MVFASAYRRYYRKPLWDDFSVQEWERKLQYRSDRRSLEHKHEPWCWDSESEDEDVDEIPQGVDREQPRASRVAEQRERNERVPKLAWDRGKEPAEMKRREDRAVDEPEKGRDNDSIRDDQHKHSRQNGLSKQQHDRVERQRKQRRVVSIEKKAKHPASSDSSSKRAKDPDTKHKSPPFLPYGWANRGPVEGMKTYNVFASPTEVYPAALRAAKRREQDIKTKSKKYEEALKKKLIRPTIEDSYPTYPKSMWLTEYQRNFCRPENSKLKV